MAIERRRAGWLTDQWHAEFRLILLHTCASHGLLCPAYCLMPDHLHLLLLGAAAGSDQLAAMPFFRKHLNRILKPAGCRLQHQAHDHVLTPDEKQRGSFENVAAYIRENPTRAGFAADWRQWPHAGCMLPGYPELDPAAETYWPSFWRIYHAITAPSAEGKSQAK
jgi:putative transposase